jgi:hypothetical protein
VAAKSDLRWRYGLAAYVLVVLAAAAFTRWPTPSDDSGLGAIWIILATLPGSIPALALPVNGDAFTGILILVGLAQAGAVVALRRLLHR